MTAGRYRGMGPGGAASQRRTSRYGTGEKARVS
jgi:hypothetical protein